MEYRKPQVAVLGYALALVQAVKKRRIEPDGQTLGDYMPGQHHEGAGHALFNSRRFRSQINIKKAVRPLPVVFESVTGKPVYLMGVPQQRHVLP